MATNPRERIQRLQERMEEAGLQALVCRLPENVVYITDHWPHHGISIAVLTQSDMPTLFIPEVEAEYGKHEWADIVPYGAFLLKDPGLYESFRSLLGDVYRRFKLQGAAVGVEQALETIGTTYRHAEPMLPAAPWAKMLQEVFPEAKLQDITDFMQAARLVKTEYDLERLRVANEIAEMGTAAFLEKVEPGMREVEVSALIEGTIRARGAGYKGARLVWAEAEVASGPNTTKANLLIPSTDRVIEEGDLVMVEMATLADGYYSDLTYMAVTGEPNARQKEVHNAVLEAQQAAAREMVAGNEYEAPDRAARRILDDAGLGHYFVHVTGHGLGFRFHEAEPFLAPGSEGTLAEGMVTSIEPGVYIPDFGGIRIEDNVAVGDQAPNFLSTPRAPW